MKIEILSGSVRKARRSHNVALEVQRRLMLSGYLQTNIIDLAEAKLPVLEGERFSFNPAPSTMMTEIHERLKEADAIILLSPEYHGSYSGALKNAVDYYWSEFSKKPMGVISVSAGKFGGLSASTQLQQLILSLGGYAMPHKLLVPSVQNVFNEKGDLNTMQ